MAEETYEFECMRAELLGLEKPNEEEFQNRLKQTAEAQLQDSELLETQMLESQDDALKNTHGKIDEINNILTSTQKKINHLKHITSISLSNLFTTDKTVNKEIPAAAQPNINSCVPTTTDTSGNNLGRITLPNENQQKKEIANPGVSFVQLEKEKKASTHLDKLDLLINKTEMAEISMSEQTKQMRKLIKAMENFDLYRATTNNFASSAKSKDVGDNNECIEQCSSAITQEKLNKWRENFYNEPKNVLAQNVCSRFDPYEACLSRKSLESINHVFSHKVEIEGKPVTNQKNSGRCWLFAALNCIRIPFMKEYNLDEFEFSQSYLFFWDKIERCNYFLNNIVKACKRGEKVGERLLSFLLFDPVSDGGQWDMLVNIITKYGVMPKKCFPESFSCEASLHMNALIKSKLREYAKVLHDLMEKNPSDEEIKSKIEEMMTKIYKIVGICLGIPSKEFVWEYYDKSKGYHLVGPITPVDFYNTMVKPVFNVGEKVCLVTDPRPTNKYSQAYTVDYLGNVVGGRPVLYNNQPVELLLDMIATSIKNCEPVWFGCEVSKRFASKQGIEDLYIHDFQLVFDVDVQKTLSKADRLIYGESAMTHAMLFTAVSLDENGEPTKFRVENSWGEDRGDKGYLVMSADWFKEFGFEIVVDKKFVPPDVLSVFDMDPIVLPAWDPMGTLAQ